MIRRGSEHVSYHTVGQLAEALLGRFPTLTSMSTASPPSTAPCAYVATISDASGRIEDWASLEDDEAAASAWPPQAGP